MHASAQSSSHLPVVAHWVGNEPLVVRSARSGEVFDPTSGAVSAHVPFATAAEVDAAVSSAHAALAGWAATPPVRRARVLFRFRQLLEAAAEEIASAISREHGKTLTDARGEITRGLEVVEFACGAPELLMGEHSESVGTGVDAFSVRQPLGVVAGITPFNFPAMVPLWMAPLALACGNTFVLKPSERDPSASILLARLLAEAGLPPGALNVVHGDREAVEALLHHPQVAAISFVGSTAAARAVHREGTLQGKRVQALGGAKNHLVVMPDADLGDASQALIGAAFGSAGERCMAISVAVVVGEPTADQLIGHLAPKIEALRVGSPFDPGTEMGPLITREHRDRVCDYIESGVREGARLIVDGRGRFDGAGGFFLGGSLFDRVAPQMRIYREEIFGPVLSIARVPDLEGAIRLINSHSYANGAAIFTRNGRAAQTFASAIEVGMVGVNVPLPVPAAFHSFGGWRSSLFGDHHIYGREGVRFYTRLKSVMQRWPGDGGDGAQFAMPSSK
jgi:malonate-semialdehyde dehydrogenase (acetylating)/methylmalonate-semialdehyde dehydrogenase